jgi:metallophosphoesterase (TIGR03767 family)
VTSEPPPLTLGQTLVPGDVLAHGSHTAYRALALAPGEPHVTRTDLGGPDCSSRSRDSRPLLVFAHATDLQLVDVQSPARFEFCNRYWEDQRFHRLVPMHRPQEALVARAAQALVRTLNALGSAPRSGADIELVLTTGDAIDNAQWNELRMFLALFEGGTVRPGSGGPQYEGVQSLRWGDDGYWTPDGEHDWYQRRHGFPRLTGLLERALGEFHSDGLQLPWLACFGNHEVLIQGLGKPTRRLQQHLVGASKPIGSFADLNLDALEDLFIEAPETFLAGEQHLVTADPERRAVSRSEFIDAHFSALSRPFGHGFTASNRRAGTAYYVHDLGDVRLICLDTTCAAGGAEGCLDEDQARWLRDRLDEVHSSRLSADGREVTTGQSDRLVIVFSHHGLDTITDECRVTNRSADIRHLGRTELRELLHGYRNVVAWVNGHAHRNVVTPRFDPLRRTAGFWEITSSALMDWPCQTRLVELLDNCDGTLSLVCTMVDHDGAIQPAPDDVWTSRWFAGLHRELAGNEPWRGFTTSASGSAADRNVDLRIPAPFPLR